LSTRASPGLATIVDEDGAETNTPWPPPEPPASASSLSVAKNNGDNNEQKERKDSGYSTDSKGPPQRRHRRHRSFPVFATSINRGKRTLERRSVGEADTQCPYSLELAGNNWKEENQQHSESSVGAMDRRRTAMGPRPPAHGVNNIGGDHSDDQRTQAFESIFGRPSAAHRDGPSHVQQRPSLPVNSSHYYSQQHPHPAHQQRHMLPLAQPQPPYQRSIRAQELPYGYPYNYSRSNRTPSSVASSGVIASPPPPSSDPSLDVYTNQGLTLAQAYQAQVFAQKQQYGGPPPGALPPSQSAPHNEPLLLPPRLDSLTLSDDGGRLSLDFNYHSPPKANGSASRTPQQLVAKFDDETDSELPWAGTGQRTRETSRS